jgi:betaine-aldehyde dehydrogenase
VRVIVQEELHDHFVDEVVGRAERIRLGGPFDRRAETGPLISAEHREKIESFVATALAEGAVLRTGGRPPDDEKLANGYYFLPTLLDKVPQGDFRAVSTSCGWIPRPGSALPVRRRTAAP